MKRFVPTTGVIPDFYWNVESQEERIKKICCMVYALEKYVEAAGDEVNGLDGRVTRLEELFQQFIESGFDDYYREQIEAWIDENFADIIEYAIKVVFFGLTSDGYFCAYVPSSWSEITFDTGAVYGTEQYGRLILRYNVDGEGVIDNTAPTYPNV